MNKYYDFHLRDNEIEWSLNWDRYCNIDDKEKEIEWTPFLSFPITKTCNFRCIYCGNGGEATASEKQNISLDFIKQYVSIAIELGINKIRITGGEPFLHPEIKEIIEWLGETGLYVLVNTNGSKIRNNMNWLKRIPNTIKFAVSFDTLFPKTLKIISGSKEHEIIKEGIKFLADNGNLLRLNMVVNKYNYSEVYNIIQFCETLGCDLKILDVVSVPVPFSLDRNDFYQEVDSLEKEFANKCDKVYSHEYSRGFGTPCYKYRFGNVYVTVKNSKKGSHYYLSQDSLLCSKCNYFPCHEGLYDLFCLSDGRICSCRWTEQQLYDDPLKQMEWLINVFKKSKFFYTGYNPNMEMRKDLI